MWKTLLELVLIAPYVIFGWLVVVFAVLFCIIETIKASRKR